jgi:hypothetical protein
MATVFGDRRQIIEYQGARWQWLGQGALAFTGLDQHRPTVDGSRGRQVTSAIADEP